MVTDSHTERDPFQSIEGTLEFMKLLSTTIEESSIELRGELSTDFAHSHESGMRLALYKLDQLTRCIQKSERILEDLHWIRRALFSELKPSIQTAE